jgi:hypothetical protein
MLAHLSKSPDAQRRGQAFEIRMFRRSQYLHPFLGEIRVETRKRQAGAIDGWLANFPMEPHARALQFHLQFFGVRIVKALNRDNRDAFLLIACGCDRLGPASFCHQT